MARNTEIICQEAAEVLLSFMGSIETVEPSSMVQHQTVMDIPYMSDPDKFSDLPDNVIFDILSLIPTEHAVQMSILSRRWRYLWTTIPTLDFDYSLFLLQNGRNNSTDYKFKFVDFVSKVLLLHGTSHLQRFRLANFSVSDFFHVNLWINAAINKNVQELHLDMPDYRIKLHPCLFTCKSLVSLKLKFRSSLLAVPTSICFPKLKTLHLESITFPETDSFLKLLAGCKILETCTLKVCQLGNNKVVDISPSTVKNLCISDCGVPSTNLKIATPNLLTFKYRGYNVKDYFENLFSLKDALIDIPIDSRYGRSCYSGSFEHVSKLLRGVSNARSLTLSDTTLEQLSNAPNSLESLPTMHNLSELILTSDGRRKHFLVIAFLLQSSPCLESLVIDIERSSVIRKYRVKKGEAAQISRKLCLGCPLNHLKVVKMRCFQGSANELEFLKLLLGHVTTMERVILIEDKVDLSKRMEIRNKVLTFQKAAANCIISFS